MTKYKDQYDDASTSDSCYLICPYCGYKDRDPYALSHNLEFSEETTCGECDRKFMAHSSVRVTYYGCPEEEPGE